MKSEEIARILLGSAFLSGSLERIQSLPRGRRFLNRLSRSRGIFESFEEGWAEARKVRYAGHDHPDVVKRHLEFGNHLRLSDYAVLYWLSRLNSPDLKVFSFGGNIGNVYYSYEPYLRSVFRNIEWVVFDLPPILERGRQIAAERRASELRFTDSYSGISQDYVALASGSFHYWERSIAAFLDQFPARPEHLIINRTPLHERHSYVTVQRMRTYAVPCIVRKSQDVISEFARLGYRLVDRWAATELSLRPPLFPKFWVRSYSGMYFCDSRD